MPEQSYKSPEVTSEMRIKYHAEAERKYRAMPEEKLQKEYNHLIRGKTPWEWFKERVGSFVNMVKIAALSVFLGRQETSRRIQSGNRDAEFEQLKKEAQKDAKIAVLEEKLETLQKNNDDKSKEEPEAKKEEPDKTDPAQGEQEQVNKNEEVSNESPNKEEMETQVQEDEGRKNVSIFAEQIECVTDKYKEGLQKYLEERMGINGAFINIENVADKDNSFLRISFDSIAFPENSNLADGITIDKKGNHLEQTDVAKDLTKAVLYYTTEVYRESKNCNRIIGTVPSQAMCTEMVQAFIDKSLKNKEKGNLNCKYEDSLFGHKVIFEKNTNSFRVFLDGKELDFPDGWSTKSLTDQIRDTMLDKEFGDFTSQTELAVSENLRETARAEVEPSYFVKYSGQELEDRFNKTLNDILHDGGESNRILHFHTHYIEVEMADREIQSISVDGENVYRDIDGKQDVTQMAEHIADNLGEKLASEDMYRFDESLEKFEDVIEFSNSDMQSKEEVDDFEQMMEYDDHDDELEQ